MATSGKKGKSYVQKVVDEIADAFGYDKLEEDARKIDSKLAGVSDVVEESISSEQFKKIVKKYGTVGEVVIKSKDNAFFEWTDESGTNHRTKIDADMAQYAARRGVTVIGPPGSGFTVDEREALKAKKKADDYRIQTAHRELTESRDILTKPKELRSKLAKTMTRKDLPKAVKQRMMDDLREELAESAKQSAEKIRRFYALHFGVRIPSSMPARDIESLGQKWVETLDDPRKFIERYKDVASVASREGVLGKRFSVPPSKTVLEHSFIKGETGARKAAREARIAGAAIRADLYDSVRRYVNAVDRNMDVGNARKDFASAIESFYRKVFGEGRPELGSKFATVIQGNLKEWELLLAEPYRLMKQKGANKARIGKALVGNALLPARTALFGDDAREMFESMTPGARSAIGLSWPSKQSAIPAEKVQIAGKALKTGTGTSMRAAVVRAGGRGPLVSSAAMIGVPILAELAESVVRGKKEVGMARKALAAESAAYSPDALYDRLRQAEILAERAARLREQGAELFGALNTASADAARMQAMRSFQGMMHGLNPYKVTDGLPATGVPASAAYGGGPVSASQVALLLG